MWITDELQPESFLLPVEDEDLTDSSPNVKMDTPTLKSTFVARLRLFAETYGHHHKQPPKKNAAKPTAAPPKPAAKPTAAHPKPAAKLTSPPKPSKPAAKPPANVPREKRVRGYTDPKPAARQKRAS